MARPTWKYKILLVFVFYAVYAVFYLFPNLRPLFPPAQLPLLSIDLTVPLVPWTFVIYISDYLLFVAVIMLVNEPDKWHSLTRMSFATLLICGLFFLFLPTAYPRPPYPQVDNPLVAFVMNLIAVADTPNNCFPSMHVAMTATATWNLRHKSPRVFLLFLAWAMAIFVSTLTTKQHYFVDIIGGLSVTALAGLLEWGLFGRGWYEALRAKLAS